MLFIDNTDSGFCIICIFIYVGGGGGGTLYIIADKRSLNRLTVSPSHDID